MIVEREVGGEEDQDAQSQAPDGARPAQPRKKRASVPHLERRNDLPAGKFGRQDPSPVGSPRARPGHPLRRRPRRGRAEPDRRRRRARRPGRDDAREAAPPRARGRLAAPAAAVRAARLRAAVGRPRAAVRAPEADAGFIIMESCSYEGMSGTNTINTATVLLETGMLPMAEPVTRARAGGAGRARAGHAPTAATAAASGSRSRTCRRSRPTSTRPSRSRGSASCGSTSPTAARSARSSTPRRSASRSCPSEARELAELGERIRPRGRRAAGDRPPGRAGPRRLSFVVFTAAPRDGRRRPQRDRRRARAARPLARPARRPRRGSRCSPRAG